MIIDKKKRLLCKGDRVRLTKEGERVLWDRPKSRKHKNGTPRSKTGVVVSNSRGSVVSVRFDSDTESKTSQSYSCHFWELMENDNMLEQKSDNTWRPNPSDKNEAYIALGVAFDQNSRNDEIIEAISRLMNILSKPDIEISKF